ncbi:MAG: HlyD family efflux transporter periplasmic adaptor subunit, partial [Planctomycetota bacterium]
MKRLTERAIHYATLGVITVAAVWVMWRMSARGGQAGDKDAEVRLLAPVAAPKSLVAVERLEIEPLEIYATFSGRIQPWETYQVGFEIAGRVQELGEDGHGRPLDVGDQVEKGQILAVLDDRTLRAYRSEAAAQVEQATSDLDRAESARRKNPTAITESDLQRYVTDLALANARLEVAAKNLEDSVLRSPVAATIAKRLAKPGESIGANQIVFELVENDKVLLVLNVPEAEVRGLEARMRQVRRERDGSGSLPLDFAGRSDIFLPTPDATLPSPDSAEGVFRAHVQLEGKDVYGRPWPKLEGNVYQIAE